MTGMKPKTMHDRLKISRQKAGYRSASQAIGYFGWKPSTYRAHENGQNPFRPSDAQEYARAYDVSAAWLLTGETDAPPFSRRGISVNNPARQKSPNLHEHKAKEILLENIKNVIVRGYVGTGVWRDTFWIMTQIAKSKKHSSRLIQIILWRRSLISSLRIIP